MILSQLIGIEPSSASPWLMRFSTVPTMRATKSERRGTPSENAQRHASLNVNIDLPNLHVSERCDDPWQFRKCFDFVVGLTRQTLFALAIPIAPDDLHAKR
jgi:hypothetical protein